MSKEINVSIVEDNIIYKDGLELILNSTPGFSCIKSFGDCESAIKAMADLSPDVLLMDIELPGMSGIEGVREIKKIQPDLDIVMLTDYGKENYIFEALKAGASGYMTKTIQPSQLLENIKIVKEGGSVMSPKIAKMVTNHFKQMSEKESPLTERETEVLSLAGDYKNNKEIAEVLFISVDTIRTHFKNIYEKLKVHSKLEAYSKASKENWI